MSNIPPIGYQATREYMDLPELPVGTSVTIHAIGAINYNPITKESQRHILYRYFRQQWPDTFPAGKNAFQDYMDDDEVSPAVVKYSSADNPNNVIKARTKMLLWFPLNDIFTMHVQRPIVTGVKMFPLPDVYIDEEDQWMATLLNAAHGKIRYCSGPNKDPSIRPDIPGCA